MSGASVHPARQRRPSRLRFSYALREGFAHGAWRDTVAIGCIAALLAIASAEHTLLRTAPPPAAADAREAAGARDAPRMQLAGAEAARREGEYLPLVTVAAVYPEQARAQGIEGSCVVEYTIAATGATRDVRARACTPEGVFERASVAAARQFKYRPRIRDGAPVAVSGVRNEFRFTLGQ